ncbi:hypothetical protein Tco_0868908, partial [Tanacetum coccineum]
LTNQVLILQSQKRKLELEKNKAKAEVALLPAQPSFPDWELLAEFLLVPTQVEMVMAKLKTLDALPSFLNKVTEALNHFAQAIASASKKTEDVSVPSAGQAGTQPVEREKNANQTTISQLFQRKTAKDISLNKQLSIPTPPIATTTTSTTSL